MGNSEKLLEFCKQYYDIFNFGKIGFVRFVIFVYKGLVECRFIYIVIDKGKFV